MRDEKEHRRRIVAQFDAQARTFEKVPGHLKGAKEIAELCALKKEDEALDAACGPGILVCELAKRCRKTVGADVSPEMLARAAARAKESGVQNFETVLCDVCASPFADGRFAAAASRYSLHHMREPGRLLAELFRVCRPGGRVVAADVAMPSEKVEAYDRLELLRDDSHVHALTVEEFETLFAKLGFSRIERASYSVEIDLETQISASRFASEEDARKFRRMIEGDAGRDEFGVAPRSENGRVVYSCPITILCGTKRA